MPDFHSFQLSDAATVVVEGQLDESDRAAIGDLNSTASISDYLKAFTIAYVSEKGRECIGSPSFSISHSPDNTVVFSATVTVYPEPEIVGYDSFQVRIPNGLQADDEAEAIRKQVFEQLLATNDFRVPQPLIDTEIRSFLISDNLVEKAYRNKLSEIDVTPYYDEYAERALLRVRLSIIIDQISAAENIQAEEEDIEAAILEIADLHDSTFEETHEYLLENGFILEVILAVTQEKVFQFLRKRTEVEYE